MKNYYQPDTIWTMFMANSPEEYIEKFVVKGHFHQAVHEDVVKSYETVEHILALAYYHYPLTDVASDKLMGIYEMTIKLRCVELGIEKTILDKNGKKRTKNLHALIDELIKKGLVSDLEFILYHLRKLRNYAAHPDRNSLMGTLSLSIMIPALNVINKLFLPQSYHHEWKNVSQNFQKRFVFEATDLFALHHENLKLLVYQPKCLDTFKIGDNWCHAISFLPVLNKTKELLSQHKIPDGIVRFLSDIIIDENGINVFDLESKQTSLIERTIKQTNVTTFDKHLAELKELDSMDVFTFESSLNDYCYRKTQQFVYENCWL